ncbi:MAG: 2-polyprenyl-3-methyl-5-hydroxy-6-metoxy-1,4-benzoquinol methylase [Gammaproteobacteria bacterium]|jgi:2-polyprenyl-3-methyl-5-hydroxy-6-metoxy-1,4-benzoquinol methylase
MKRHADSRSGALRSSWELNAQLWTAAVRESIIASRAAGTDQAIVDAVIRCKPRSVIDIGCGEGWLMRRLSREHDYHATGVEAVRNS